MLSSARRKKGRPFSRGFHGNSIATKWLYRLTDAVDWEEIARYYIDEIDS